MNSRKVRSTSSTTENGVREGIRGDSIIRHGGSSMTRLVLAKTEELGCRAVSLIADDHDLAISKDADAGVVEDSRWCRDRYRQRVLSLLFLRMFASPRRSSLRENSIAKKFHVLRLAI